MGHDVFISYSHENSEASLAICHALEQNKIKCWIAPRNIPSGSEYGDVIESAICNCKVFIIIFSKSASTSNWVRGELNVAFTEQKHIIPYRIDTTPLEGGNRVILNQYHWIDAYPDYEKKFQDLILSISNILGKSPEIPLQENIHQTNTTNQIPKDIKSNSTFIDKLKVTAAVTVTTLAFPFLIPSKKKK